MSDVAPQDLVAVAARLRSGRLAFQQYLDETLERVAVVDRRLQALIPEAGRKARLEADFAELQAQHKSAGRRVPPLYGVLVGIKDIFRVDGLLTRAGSELPAEVFAGPEAEAVTRLRRAGAAVLGKTVTTEFAYFAPGPTRNPWNPEHTPGGSSSGSAAAVAAGFTPLALGTQTIGSVTRPAAFCGIVGFKPSLGRIPTGGVISFSRSVDQVGLFAANVASASAGAALLCDNWIARRPLRGRRPTVGLLEDACVAQAEEPARRAVVAAAERIAAAGYTVKRLALFADIERINALHLDLVAHEFAQLHEQWHREYGSLYTDESKELIEKGRGVSPPRAEAARHEAGTARERVQQAMRQAGVSVVLSPAATGEAPEGIGTTGSPIMNLPWTFFGLPTVTVPCGFGPRGLPLGLQIAGYLGADEQLFVVAAGIETALGKPEQTP